MNPLCCLFLELGLSQFVAHDHPTPLDRPSVQNPYGTVSIGTEQQFGPISLSLSLFHTSSIATRYDQGDDGISFRIRYSLRRSF